MDPEAYTVNVSELFGRQFGKDKHYYKMFAIHPDYNLVFLKDGKGKTVSYDMDNQKVSVISTFRSESVDGALYLYVPCSFA